MHGGLSEWLSARLGVLWGHPMPAKQPAPSAPRRADAAKKPRQSPMQDKYDALVTEMKATYGFRVRKWRSSTSGCAWEVHYHDGKVIRLLESPYPRGPMSCAVFLHEVGHHAIGLGAYKPRCLEEYHAWRWSLEAMAERGFNVTAAVLRRRDDALRYAIAKARRRGLKRLPVDLAPWGDPTSDTPAKES